MNFNELKILVAISFILIVFVVCKNSSVLMASGEENVVSVKVEDIDGNKLTGFPLIVLNSSQYGKYDAVNNYIIMSGNDGKIAVNISPDNYLYVSSGHPDWEISGVKCGKNLNSSCFDLIRYKHEKYLIFYRLNFTDLKEIILTLNVKPGTIARGKKLIDSNQDLYKNIDFGFEFVYPKDWKCMKNLEKINSGWVIRCDDVLKIDRLNLGDSWGLYNTLAIDVIEVGPDYSAINYLKDLYGDSQEAQFIPEDYNFKAPDFMGIKFQYDFDHHNTVILSFKVKNKIFFIRSNDFSEINEVLKTLKFI